MGEPLRLLARLNEETQCHHPEANHDVDRYLFASRVTSADYRTFLLRVYGFVASLEQALVATPGLAGTIDVPARIKAPLVVHDLLALGMTMDELAAWPRFTGVPTFRNVASALGWMYVVERPLLSAAVIRGHLATFLPTEMITASAYLGCYAGDVGMLWRELGEVMDRTAVTEAITNQIVHAAHEGFRALVRARTIEHDLDRALRIAG
jgi:heme oxygenase (biliverdin-IX-beta and delta-forming)